MKRKLTTFALSLIMVFAMAAAAFAAEVPTVGTGTAQENATVSVYKNFALAEGITVPDTSFEFEVTPITADAPAAAVAPISYTAADTQKSEKADGVVLFEIEKESPIRFEAFPHAGVFEYTVKEKAGAYEGIEYSAEEYLLRVYVANKEDQDGGLFVQSITAENSKKEKQSKIVFTNTYRKVATLEILKQTTGSLADKTKQFDFTIQFAKSATSNDTEFTGMMDGTPLSCPVGQTVSFQLRHGQKLVFENLPAGTRYIVTEKGAADGYTPKVTVIENGVQLSDKQGAEAEDLNSSAENAVGNLVGEGKNEVTFVNEYHEVPITGVILNNMPFVVLIGAAVLAFVLLAGLKRRKATDR